MRKPTTPLLTVDIIIETTGGIVLIERKNPPPGWALPGGFVDVGESLAHAARARGARRDVARGHARRSSSSPTPIPSAIRAARP